MKTYTLQINRHGNMIVCGDEIARKTYRTVETSNDYYYLLAKKNGSGSASYRMENLYQAQDSTPKRKKAISYKVSSYSYKPAAPKPNVEAMLADRAKVVADREALLTNASKPKTKEEVLLDECERIGEESYVPKPKAAPKPKPTKKGLTKQQLLAIKEIQKQVALITDCVAKCQSIAQQTIDSITSA